MSLSIGLQLFSVKNALKQDFVGTLEKVAEIGFQNVEMVMSKTNEGLSLGGAITPVETKKQLDRLGLRVVGCHTRVNDETDWDAIIEACHVIGCKALGNSIAFFANKDDVLRFCESFNRYAELCKKNGLNLYYHNHFQEFQVFEGQVVMDLLLEHTDKDLVTFELDTYWATRGGVDPIAWLYKLGDRCTMIHQKDLPAAVQPVNLFDVYGADSTITIDDLLKTQDPANFTEIGAGILDLAGTIRAARTIGSAQYILVEQDVAARGEVEGIAISYRNLDSQLKKA
jgi:sugar phosphate isomerase/epimerase